MFEHQHQPHQYGYPPYPMMMPQPPVPLQVQVAFKLLDSLNAKEMPIVAVTSIAAETVERKELLPVEEKARATALELLIAYMRSALQ